MGAEVNCKDVVTEACDVIQLLKVPLQGAAGQTGFVKRSHKAKHKGVQTGGPTQMHPNTSSPVNTQHSYVISTPGYGLFPGSIE